MKTYVLHSKVTGFVDRYTKSQKDGKTDKMMDGRVDGRIDG